MEEWGGDVEDILWWRIQVGENRGKNKRRYLSSKGGELEIVDYCGVLHLSFTLHGRKSHGITKSGGSPINFSESRTVILLPIGPFSFLLQFLILALIKAFSSFLHDFLVKHEWIYSTQI